MSCLIFPLLLGKDNIYSNMEIFPLECAALSLSLFFSNTNSNSTTSTKQNMVRENRALIFNFLFPAWLICIRDAEIGG